MEEVRAAIYASARDVADAAVDAFSGLHPEMRMNITEWQDLKESIYKEVLERFSAKQ